MGLSLQTLTIFPALEYITHFRAFFGLWYTKLCCHINTAVTEYLQLHSNTSAVFVGSVSNRNAGFPQGTNNLLKMFNQPIYNRKIFN